MLKYFFTLGLKVLFFSILVVSVASEEACDEENGPLIATNSRLSEEPLDDSIEDTPKDREKVPEKPGIPNELTERDSDGDGILDYFDGCPADPNKKTPGPN